jgi:anionic cell wall polymer biosynthesis LytR-Cps2A-Psr (LCP) family protein
MRGIINAIGGIDVYSPVAFDSDISEYSYVKGWNHLNGKQALYFARERHAFEGQDSARVENQQRVVRAVIDKMTGSPAILLKYGEIMEVAGSNLSTNMSYDEIQDLVKMQMTDLASWDIESQKVEGEYDMDYVASLSHKNKYSVYRTDPESVQKCLDKIYEVMHPTSSELEEAEKNQRQGFIDSIIKNAKDRVENGKDADPAEEG